MKTQILTPNTVPTANIAVNKSRLKVYKNAGELPTYYLQKGQEFQIELFNPTPNVILAKIILNGKAISQGGLVLNPGQRVYLDRYLDVAKKFLFDTYEVGKSAEVMAAIKNNGDFKVEFYKEQIQLYIPPMPDYTYRPLININTQPYSPLRASGAGGYSGNINCNGTVNYNQSPNTTLSLNGLNGTITNSNSLNASTTSSNSSYTNSLPSMDSLSNELSFDTQSLKKSSPIRSKALFSKTVETGRVEMGSVSEQKLKIIDKTFEYFAFHSIEYKMLPLSQKINTAEDINVKRYCTQCGAKVGKTDNFCASCGKKA